jgi:molybdate transport system substrate-binding protein
MVRRFAATLLAGAFWFPLLASPESDRKPVLVYAATGTPGVIEKIGRQFTQRSGDPVRVTGGGSPGLSRQILAGAPADLFISAGIANLAPLRQAGLIDEQSTTVWMRSRLVVIAPAQAGESLTSVQQIADARFRHLAVADASRAPVGIYARQSLSFYRIWDAVRGRVVEVPDGQSVLASVESGAADLGVVMASDALTSPAVKIVLELPEESHQPIQYLVSLVAHSAASPAVRPFMIFLKSDEARKLLVEAGFVPAFP